MLDDFTPELTRPMPLANRLGAGLRRAIVFGELAPGVHLQEPQLAQKFGVSEVQVRAVEREGIDAGWPPL